MYQIDEFNWTHVQSKDKIIKKNNWLAHQKFCSGIGTTEGLQLPQFFCMFNQITHFNSIYI